MDIDGLAQLAAVGEKINKNASYRLVARSNQIKKQTETELRKKTSHDDIKRFYFTSLGAFLVVVTRSVTMQGRDIRRQINASNKYAHVQVPLWHRQYCM